MNGKLFWGVDNLHFVERELGGKSASPPRLTEPPKTPQSVNLTIYYDLGSPWSFLGSTQVTHVYKFFKIYKKTSPFINVYQIRFVSVPIYLSH